MAMPLSPAATVVPRRERMRAQMRGEILAAARTIIQEQGIGGLAMRALGRAVGVTAPTLYDYFPSKDDVLNALFIEATELLAKALTEAGQGLEPGLPLLKAVGKGYRAFAVANPDLYMLLFGRVNATYRPGDEEINCAHNQFGNLVDLVAYLVARGELSPGDPELMAHAIWTLAHGSVTLEIGNYTDKLPDHDPDAIYDGNFRWLLLGMGADPEKLG